MKKKALSKADWKDGGVTFTIPHTDFRTRKKSMIVVSFSKEEIEHVQGAAHAVWEECAFDVLQATADEPTWRGGKARNINSVTVSRAEVMEIACDAGRLEELLRRRDKRVDLADKTKHLWMEHFEVLLRPAFPYARYGT